MAGRDGTMSPDASNTREEVGCCVMASDTQKEVIKHNKHIKRSLFGSESFQF